MTQAVVRPTVLVVEDDPDIRGAMAEALQEEGYEVAMAINAREGLRVLVSLDTPCLVLLDLEIPRVDGHGLIERLRTDTRFAGTRVVGMTAEPGPTPPGVSYMLRKPVRLETLLAIAVEHCPRQAPAARSG